MPVVPINYVAVLIAAIAAIAVGFVWYGPLFGKPWMKLMGFTKESMDAAKKKGMTQSYAIMIVSTLAMTYVLAHAFVFASTYMKVSGVSAGLSVGFWNWLGFIAPVTLGKVIWEGKPWKLWLIDNGHYLSALLIMGVILASWK